jgi:hypothetical protein
MAYEISGYSVKVTLVAAADLSGAQYKFVKLDSAGKAALVAADTDRPIGVLQNAPLAGQEASVLVTGGTKLVLGATLTPASVLGTTATGTGAARTVGTDLTKYILGAILQGGASGEIGSAVINCSSAARAV